MGAEPRREGSDRAPADASPAAPGSDEAMVGTAAGVAAAAAEETTAASEAAAAERGRDAETSASVPWVEADEAGAAGEQRPAAPQAEEVDEGGARGKEGLDGTAANGAVEGSIAGEVRDVDPVVSEQAGMEGVGGGAASKDYSVASTVSEANAGSVLGTSQDLAPVVSETKMEVDGGSVLEREGNAQEQDCTAAAVAIEVKMEEGDGGVVNQGTTAPAGGIQAKEEVGECLVGRYVGRSAPGYARILIGKVASYDSTAGVYSVVFEDGHTEESGLPQLLEFLMSDDNGALGMKVSCRKRKLDLLVSSGSALEVKEPASTRQRVDGCEMPARPDELQHSASGSDMSEDVESSSNSSDFTREETSEPCPSVQAVELPPSSGDIPVPEESISSLFSVYNFLRSFSVQLFLSPFGLDDFVAAINCSVQNNLLDAVHVSLLQALRRHLESKSAEGSRQASDCLKYLDWTLLDALTWPNFLLEYLYVMRSIKNLGGKSFGRSLLVAEYYKLPVAMKLRVLQILCDDVNESEELKTELENRVGYNEEMEYEIESSVFQEAASRGVSTRAAKASAYKNTNDFQNLENVPNVTNPETAVAVLSQDGNSDDCRICGMDGTLVCCDGCPWAYHSRCIGQNKAFLPQGDWFCPECVVNKLGPTSSRIERGARGAQMFGIDTCGRLFLGTCNYLLVIETASDAESYARYYNQYDVAKVLQRLAVSDAYVDICRQIKDYWKHLLGIIHSERSATGKEVGVNHTPRSSMLNSIPIKAGDGSVRTTLKDGGDRETAALPQTNVQQKFVANQSAVCSAESLEEQKCKSSFGAVIEKNAEVCKQTVSAQNNVHNAHRNGAFGPPVVSSISHQNGPIVTGVSNIAQAQLAQSIFHPDSSTVSATAGLFCPSSQGKHHLQLFPERSGNMSGGKAAKLSSFKPQAYMNLYNHGNIAASAAANLAVITSDEGKVSASQLTAKPRKKMAADNALQLKAFSSAATQFLWPSTEKKLMEVPRDRCGWCIACRSSASGTKKACFLNMATTNASKCSARILSAMRVIKNSDSHFPSIVAYLANMEESLRGLLVGSLQDMQQKKRWHQQLQEASNCRTVIPLLLELESNIRGVAFSASWLKPIDDWPVESPGPSTGASRPAQYQKRGVGGRRGRRRSLASESGTATDEDNSWTWWTGGNISKRTLQRGALLHSTIRKAARQGGKQRIAGLSYHEGSNFPRRSRQFVWRGCVGMSQTSSQLALQVRYLDAHIRWKEFIPPDQIPSDGKSSDTDFSALRNAVVCDKKIIDNKIRYALKFRNQKHLPVRVTKNILESEGDQDENSKLWFSENHVPLYMLREFEQHTSLPTPGISDSNCFTNLYPRRVKASAEDVFSYLFHKGEVYPCTSCKKDVLYRDIVKCSTCQGNCHKDCTSNSVVNKGSSATSSLICKLCLQKRNLMLTSYNTNTSYFRPQQKSNGQQPVTAPRIVFKVSSSHSGEPAPKVEAQLVAKVKAQPFAKVEAQPTMNVKTQPVVNVKTQPFAKVEAQPIMNEKAQPLAKVANQSITSVQALPKTKAKKSKSEKEKKPKKVQAITYFGLVWKKNKSDKDDGSEFRANDVILKSKDSIGSSIRPTCCLCDKAYSPDFLYVRCEKCRNWFHGDALQLDEERIGELVAYRCCRCRRRAIPHCPHSDGYTKPEPELSEQTVATSSQSTMLSSEETFALADQDPLLASYGIVEPIGDDTMDIDLSMNMASFGPGSNQKLSIRRAQANRSEYLDQAGRPVNEYNIQNHPPGNGNINFSHTNGISFSEADSVDASELLGWDFSQGVAYATPPDFTADHQSNDTSCGSFGMDEYEPQTYFSFTELLEADDTQLDNAFGMSAGLQGDGNGTGSFVQQGVGFDELSFIVEDGASNMNFPTNDPTPDEVACNKCMNTQPPPDLKCAVCDLHIHRQCSPWDQGEEPVNSSNWSCGGCREWR